jgi:hypothetical protein
MGKPGSNLIPVEKRDGSKCNPVFSNIEKGYFGFGADSALQDME